MTRQENILTLNEHLDHWKRLLSEKICDHSEGEKTIDALQNAIKALEQQPCEDAISRQAVLEKAINVPIAKIMADDKVICRKVIFVDDVEKLPPVTQQQKMGYISIDDVMAVFDDFMRGDVDENNTETFLEMLKDKAEGSEE